MALRLRARAFRRAVRTGLGSLSRLTFTRSLHVSLAGVLTLSTPVSLRADEPSAPPMPAEGVVAWAWADGSSLVGPGAAAADAGIFHPLTTLVNVVAPGAGASARIGAIDAAASAAVLAGGSASVSVSEVVPVADGPRLDITRATISIRSPDGAAARVRELLAKAGAASVKESPFKPAGAKGSVGGVEFAATFGAEGAGAASPSKRVPLHRESLTRLSPKGSVCAQVYVDLNAIRERVPDAMDNTPLSRVLGVWALGNARDVMVSARVIQPADVPTRDPGLVLPPGATPPAPYVGPAMVRVDITWSNRSEPPSSLKSTSLAGAFWSGGKDNLPAGARWVVAVRSELGLFTMVALRTCAARLEPAPRAALSRDVDRWAGAQGAAMDRLVQASRGWIVLWPSADPKAGAGALDWRLVPDSATPGEAFNKDLGGVMTAFPLMVPDGAGVRVATLPGMTVGFATAPGGGVVGRVEFDEAGAERTRAAVTERTTK